jgi:hypothetical protein
MYGTITTTSWTILNNYLATLNCRFLWQTCQIRSRIRIRIRQKVRHPTNGSGVGQGCNAQGELSLVLVNLFRDSKKKKFLILLK